jgi:hypothetical protein
MPTPAGCNLIIGITANGMSVAAHQSFIFVQQLVGISPPMIIDIHRHIPIPISSIRVRFVPILIISRAWMHFQILRSKTPPSLFFFFFFFLLLLLLLLMFSVFTSS